MVVVKWRKHCVICGEGVEVLGVVEAIIVRRPKWLVAFAEFVVKRSGVVCCEDFSKTFVVIMVSVANAVVSMVWV